MIASVSAAVLRPIVAGLVGLAALTGPAALAPAAGCAGPAAPPRPSPSPSASPSPSPSASLDPAARVARMARRLDRVTAHLIEVRRDLHRHPELAGDEHRTAAAIAGALDALGVPYRAEVAGHGIVATVRGGRPGPVVAYRADMDAVATDAPDPVEFRSDVAGVRHACGHDVHVVTALGVIEALDEIRAGLPGTVVVLFQPAEENATGAAAMIADGALDHPAPAAIFALHSAPLPVGTIGTVRGPALPGLAEVEVTLAPGADLDQRAARAAAAIAAVSTVAPGDPEAGATPDAVVAGVVGTEATDAGGTRLRALVRAVDPAVRERAVAAVRAGLVAALGQLGPGALVVHVDAVPSTINDAALVGASLPSLRAALGDEQVIEVDQPVPFFSEDFAFYQQRIPGALYWLGVSAPDRGTVGLPHSPDFVADERAIRAGALAMATVLADYLDRHAGAAPR